MVEFPFYDREVYSSVKQMLETVCEKYSNNVAYQYWENKKVISKTYNEFFSDVCRFTNYLKERDLLGKHIALIGKTSYLWLVSYFGIIVSGSVVVPIDKELDDESVWEQLELSDSSCIMYEQTYEHVAKSFLEKAETSPVTVCLNSELRGYIENTQTSSMVTNEYIGEDSLAIIVFTSGTSGKSKAVMLSQKNIITDACCIAMVVNQNENSCALSVLPTNHMFEIASSIMCALYFGARLCINDSLRNVKKNLNVFKPTVLVVVPLFVDTFYKEIKDTIKRKHLTIPFEILRCISSFLKMIGVDVRQKLFKTIHQSFGGNLQLLICGGAMLDINKIKFFNSIGINILQGYGITECSPAVACNTDRYTRSGSVGKVLPCSSAKIIDGEIVVKGSNVMMGYYKAPEETEKVLKDGWFYTGDLGYMDDDGYIYLTGRKKNLIILSNGENVSPEEIEMKLQNVELVKEVLVSCNNDCICAEIFYGEYDSTIEEQINKQIAASTKKWPIYKQPQVIKFRYTEFEKTTTKKIKRSV